MRITKALFALVILALSSCAHTKVVEKKISRREISVHFSFDSHRLRDGERAILDERVKDLKSHPHTVVLLEGYADPVGDEEYNLELSDRRARAIKAYFIAQGIEADRIVAVGYGEKGGGGLRTDLRRRVELSTL